MSCKKCKKSFNPDEMDVFFSIYSKSDFCGQCIADTLRESGVYALSYLSKGGTWKALNPEEIYFAWESLDKDEKESVNNLLAKKLTLYRSVEDMSPRGNKVSRRLKMETLAREAQAKSNSLPPEKMTQIYNDLSKYLESRVIGQQDLKRKSLYCVSRFITKTQVSNTIEMSNLLVIGESGTGKTETFRAIRDFFKNSEHQELKNIPFIEVDASSLSPTSYKGLSVAEGIFQNALNQCNNKKNIVEKGTIIFLDEFDKLFTSNNESKITVAMEILKVMEGGDYSISVRSGMGDKTITFDTSNFLFVCSGAFTPLLKQLKQVKNKRGIGFVEVPSTKTQQPSKEEGAQSVKIEDMVNFGVPNEILGRLPIKAITHTLTENDYYRILTELDSGPLQKGEEFLNTLGIKERIPKSKLKGFASMAASGHLGARELKTQIEIEIEKIVFRFMNGSDQEDNSGVTKINSELESFEKILKGEN